MGLNQIKIPGLLVQTTFCLQLLITKRKCILVISKAMRNVRRGEKDRYLDNDRDKSLDLWQEVLTQYGLKG